MKKTLTFSPSTLPAVEAGTQCALRRALKTVARVVETSYPVTKLSAFYSKLLGEHVTPRRTLRLANAQASAFMLLCADAMSTAALIVLAVWAGVAIYGCAKN